MKRIPGTTEVLAVLALGVMVVFAVPNPSVALTGGEEAGTESVRVPAERGGGCGCRNRGGDAEGAGSACRGKKAGKGSPGVQSRESDAWPGRQGQGQGARPTRARACGRAGKSAEARGRGMQGRRGPNQDVMQATRALVHDYRDDLVRVVEEIENGVVTVTRSPENPEAVSVLQRHVNEMKGLLENGGRIRVWDPLFSELFDHYEEVEMVVETLEDGVRVTETSANPEVVKLIQAHARKVDEFVARGPAAAHEPTPLPSNYRSRRVLEGETE